MQDVAGVSPGAADTPVTAEEVRAQMERIVASERFASSHRLCRFLRFIVERTLENHTDRLKEFVVAIEVFDRAEDYDPNIDSIVRVEARRLRTKLKAYYDGPGSADPVLILLRPGSYVPLFQVKAAAGPAPAGAPRAIGPYTTVAVLPFVNMSPEPEQDYFCDGITEEIINALTSIEGLGVVARTSAFQFKGKAVDIRDVGRQLGAGMIVEGSVRRAGRQIRITAQAIDAVRGYHLWSETYSRELDDIFAIQEDLSRAIAGTLQAKLPERGPEQPSQSRNLHAYTGFLKGMFLVHQQKPAGLHEAADTFRQLIREYPHYAPPYAGLAAARSVLTLFGAVPGKAILDEVRRCAEKAVRLDADSADAWMALAGVRGHFDFDWADSERCFDRALQLQPGGVVIRAWYGMSLAILGRLDEAQAELAKVAQLNPLAASDHARVGYLHYLRGEDAAALHNFEIASQLDAGVPEGHLYPALLYLRRRDYNRAVAILSPNHDWTPFAVHTGLLGAAYGFSGKQKQARDCLVALETGAGDRHVTPLALAWVHLGLGEIDLAFDHLSRAVADRAVFVQFAGVDPLYEPLRQDPRFTRLLESMNLTRR